MPLRFRSSLTGLTLVLLGTACPKAGTQGRPFDTTHRKDLARGVDEATVIGWFGPPEKREPCTSPDCSVKLQWLHSELDTDVLTIRVLLVMLDSGGKVIDAAYTCQGNCIGTNAVAGVEAPRGSGSIIPESKRFDLAHLDELVPGVTDAATAERLVGAPLSRRPRPPTVETLGGGAMKSRCVDEWRYQWVEVDYAAGAAFGTAAFNVANASAHARAGESASFKPVTKETFAANGVASKDLNLVMSLEFDGEGKLCSFSFTDASARRTLDPAQVKALGDGAARTRESIRATFGRPVSRSLPRIGACRGEHWLYSTERELLSLQFDEAGHLCAHRVTQLKAP